MDKLLSTKEAAAFLHVSLRTFKYWTSANKIAPVQFGAKGAKFYSQVQLESFKGAKVNTTRAKFNFAPVTSFKSAKTTRANCTPEIAPVPPYFARVKGDTMTTMTIKKNFAHAEVIDTAAQVATAEDNNETSAQIETPDVVDTDKSKDFLPMATAPHFDTIPQFLKGLKRWVCWRLIPKKPNDKKDRKIPMVPNEDGNLNATDHTNPKNWLTFADAINCYQKNLCSGIGFCLTDTAPKICCVDVDHCVNPDGSLNDEAKDVITICADSFTELSQSGEGIHIWFEDNEFPGEHGRKRGNVEVYAFKRFIAITGNHVADTADDIKHVDKACSNVISKFIDRREDSSGNLFDTKPARTTADKKILTATADVTLTDDDDKLVNYFRSEKCRDKDSNMFDLFNGNTDAYFKNTGKVVDDSVADCDLLLKILWYIGGESGSDDDIGRHALNLFNASALAKREKWLSREDYRIMTINNALDLWRQNGRKAREDNYSGGSAQIEDLRAVKQQLDEFDAEKNAALETLRNLEKFDYETVFDEAVITCAAFARIFEPSSYSELRHGIKLYRKEHADTGVDLNDYGAVTKDRAEEIQARYDKLLARRNELQAAIRTEKFLAANQDELAGYVIPDGYSVSVAGIEKIKAKGNELVCRQPVAIDGKVVAIADDDLRSAGNKFKLALKYKTPTGKWRTLQPQAQSIVFNAKRLVDLADNGLPVTSVNANAMVEYLDAFRAENANRLKMTYEVSRCGWHEFHGKKIFIDPRLKDCVIEAEGKKITCAVSDASEFAKHLRTKGSIDEWRKAYQLAKKTPVARIIVAASVAAPLLDIVGERNFMLYLKARTRAGKTTAMLLGASAIGDEKIVRSFDSTQNGLIGAAADVNDYCFCVDEKQVSDNRLKENLADLVYSLANGVGRTRLNRDSTLKKLQDWRTIAIATGETDLLPENATDGADTRLLTLHAPDTILTADDCRQIRGIIKDNFGHALPLVIDEIKTIGKVVLVGMFNQMVDTYATKFKDMLPEHCRYMAVITLADAMLNSALGVDTVTLPDGKKIKPSDDAVINLGKVFSFIPTAKDISATDREKAFVRDFVGENQNNFVGGAKALEHMLACFGKLDDPNYIYVTCKALKDACNRAGFDYRKLRDDLASAGFFDDFGGKSYVKCRVGKVAAWCHRIKHATFNEDAE